MENVLKGNSYPGRGIIVGKSENGKYAAVAYFIMGRSENSRNRVFVLDNDSLFTRPYDESKVKDPSLIIYKAMSCFDDKLVVTNGDQTDTIVEFLEKGSSFENALQTRTYEPDSPNYTPRISAQLSFDNNDFKYLMSILKKDNKSQECDRYFYEYKGKNGKGHLIHTYKCDGEPIPSFEGDPKEINICDDINEFTDKLWKCLDENNKVSLFVRYIDLETRQNTDKIKNKNGLN